YTHSYLPDYVEEKTGGRIKASAVERFVLQDVRADCLPRLQALENNVCCVVDAETQTDLNHFCSQLMQAAQQGKRFLFRSAASLLTALAQLPAQPVAAEKMRDYVVTGKAGAVIVGSHVKKTTEQLSQLLEQPGIKGIEIDVSQITSRTDDLLSRILTAIVDCHASNITPVIYTSRTELQFDNQQTRLAFGEKVSAFLMDVVRHLPASTGFLISKGGITSNDVLSDGLALRTSRVAGQILPGCSVVRCPHDHPRFPDMPVVIFPGNVGDNNALATAYQRMNPVI
ncbi:MAG: four-carbon acid sugar kinase family protein, partial [Gammaproteobacteria bacterium]|nr:four-carbon acid sugar kinase family protein [Gammaproteobacteria bacterium]